MKKIRRFTALALAVMVVFAATSLSYGADTAYSSSTVNRARVNAITVNINSPAIKPVILQANSQINSTQPLSVMASNAGAVAAINGTYFEAYNGVPVPWGAIIKDGKVIHAGGGAVFGITKDNKFLVDNLKFDFESYADGKLANVVWRVNHPSTEADAITAFTPEYKNVTVPSGGKAVVVNNGVITNFSTTNCSVPSNGLVIVFNPAAVEFMYDRYAVGMTCELKTTITPKHTTAAQWSNVNVGLGAGPSLIINGQITADGASEGFTEAKIITNKAGRSFIGATAENKIVMGNISSATLKEAATICQSLGLVNAMCLDGGGSISLYYSPTKLAQNGRAVNNGLGFVATGGNSGQVQQLMGKPTNSKVLVDGKDTAFDAYNIENNNYFKLRDLATVVNGTEKQFEVQYDNSKKAINLLSNQAYTPAGGEMVKGDGSSKPAAVNTAKIYKDGKEISLKAYTIGGFNYFKLRDIAKAFNIGVTFDKATETIGIDTKISYTE